MRAASSFTVADNISQAGSSVLSAMSAVPGVTVGQEGKVELRGSDKVLVLIAGVQRKGRRDGRRRDAPGERRSHHAARRPARERR